MVLCAKAKNTGEGMMRIIDGPWMAEWAMQRGSLRQRDGVDRAMAEGAWSGQRPRCRLQRQSLTGSR